MKKVILLFSFFFISFFVNNILANELAEKQNIDQKWYDNTKIVFLGGSFTCDTRKMAEKIYNILQIRDAKFSNSLSSSCSVHQRLGAVEVIKYVDNGKIAEINYAFPNTYLWKIMLHGWIPTVYLHSRKEVAKRFIGSK